MEHPLDARPQRLRAQRSYTVLQTDPRLLGQRFGVCAAALAVPLGSSSGETASTIGAAAWQSDSGSDL
jgi:hypothetical protein